jgi:poly [ADP-ribose] polymerase
MTKPVIRESDIGKLDIAYSHKQSTLNFTDISCNNNKTYSIELIETKDNKFYLLSCYGRTGSRMTTEYRACSDISDAEKELEKIVKSKIKKGYSEIKLIKSAIGSELAQAKVESSVLSEATAVKMGFKVQEEAKSSLHPAIQSVVKEWFGSIDQFIIDTLDTSKCALGQLSLEQINKGRDLLLEARNLVNAGSKDITSLNSISSKYYSNIPMNFGFKRLNADQLRFDDHVKLDAAFDVLDTLENAKDVEKILIKKSDVDQKYQSLKTPMEWVDPSDLIFKWIDLLFHKTRAANHNFYGKLKINNIFKLTRSKEFETYLSMAESMAKKDQARKELPSMLEPLWKSRIKEQKEYEKLYHDANILPLFHGTRTQNINKILSSRLILPKPGFTFSGAMFSGGAGGIYSGFSTKACGYSSLSGSAWAKGNSDKGYLFLNDVALGKQKIAEHAHPYTLDKIKPCMSVWAKAGKAVINDEFIVFTEEQTWIRYVVEVVQAK